MWRSSTETATSIASPRLRRFGSIRLRRTLRGRADASRVPSGPNDPGVRTGCLDETLTRAFRRENRRSSVERPFVASSPSGSSFGWVCVCSWTWTYPSGEPRCGRRGAAGALGELGSRIDAGELRGFEQAAKERCDLGATLRLRPEVVLASDDNTFHRALRSIHHQVGALAARERLAKHPDLDRTEARVTREGQRGSRTR